MVKFAQNLLAKENPAWKNQYLDYQDMKQLLYDGIEKAPKILEPDGRLNYWDYVSKFDDVFFKTIIASNLEKVNKFFKDKTRDLVVKFLDLKSQVESPSTVFTVTELPTGKERKKNFWNRLTQKFQPSAIDAKNANLEQVFRDFYFELLSLAKFQELNYTGFHKILKKHDKLFGNTLGHKTLKEKVTPSPFHVSKDVEKMIRETEQIYTTTFEGGSRAQAMKKLTLPHRDEKLSVWTAFKLGLMVGICVVLLAVFSVSGILDPSKNKWRIVVRFYRGTAVLTLYLCLIGVNMYAWRRRGINHVYIFELDIHDHLLHHHFWNVAAFFGVIWAVSVVVFLNSENIGIPVYVSPFVLLLIQVAFLFNPFPLAYWSSRKWLIKVFLRIFTAPFHQVTFADFWICDQLSSLIAIVLDYQYIICFYCTPGVFEVTNNRVMDSRVCITMDESKCVCDSGQSFYRHLIRAIPSILRVIQCFRRFYDNNRHLVFPHLINSLKYFCSLLVVVFSALNAMKVHKSSSKIFFHTWIAVSIVSSIVSYIWDVKMDWGLFECGRDKKILRSDLLYPVTWFYYAAVVGDFFLRFSWAVALPLTEMKIVNADILLTVTTPVEIFRRFVWNLFRLENEQIHNNNAQLALNLEEVSSTTSEWKIEEEEQKELVRIMDDPDGVPNKKRSIFIIPRMQSRNSSLSTKFIDSKTELFTRVSSQVDQRSNDISSEDKFSQKKSFCRKFKDFFCCRNLFSNKIVN